MILEEYKELLKQHDWYYHMSDDFSKYSVGYDNDIYLRSLKIDKPDFEQAYKEEQIKYPLI